MSDTTYKIGVEITGDDSRFRATAKSSEKAVSDLEKKASSDVAKLKANLIGMFSAKGADTGIAKFTSEIGAGTGALEAFAGPAGVAVGVTLAFAGAAVSAGTAMFALAKEASDYGSEIADAEAKTGLTAESLSALRYQAQLSGSDFGELSGGISKFTKTVGESAKGNEEATQKLKNLGLDPQEAVKDLDGALTKVFKTINDAKPGVNQMTAAQDAFGKSGANLIPTIKSMDGDFAALKKRATELGIVLSEEDVRAADAFGDTLDTVTLQAKGAAYQFAYGFMPAITHTMDEISGSLKNNKDVWREWGEYVGGKILETTHALQSYAAIANDVYNGNFSFSTFKAQGLINAEENRKFEFEKLKNQPTLPGVVPTDAELSRFGPSGDYLDKSSGAGVSKGAAKSSSGGGKMNFEMSSKGKALVEAANKLGINPLDLAAIISYETSGTFNPSIKGGKGNNYQGLIQFGQEERSTYGVTKGQSFEQQILGPVVKYFQDRFASVGKSTVGATLLDLYKTVNGGNPTVSANASDGNGTISQHVQRIASQHKSNALKYFFGGNSKNVKGLDGAEIAKRENDEFERGAALVKQYDDQVKNLGVTTERRKVDLILETGEYAKLSEAQKQKIRDDADAIDSYTKEAQASENYSAFVKSLLDDYGALNNVQPTATEQLNKYIAANKEAGVIMDESDIATVKRIATLFDLAKAQEKENDLVQVETQRYRDERDAIWETVAAQQALTNQINRAALKPEQNFGVKNPNPGIADDDPTPKFKRTISANAMANATGRDFAAGGIFDQNTVDTQVSLMATLKETGMDTFKALAGEIGNAAAQWLAYGGASEQSLGQATKAVLASVAAQALGTGLFELGIGFAALTPWGEAIYGPAPLHFKSAAILLGMGAAFGGLARAIPGGGGSGNNSQKDSPDYLRADSSSPDYLRQNQSGNNPSQQQQFGELSNAVNGLTETVSRLKGIKPGEMLQQGIEQKPGLITNTTTKELNGSGTKATQMGKALRLK